MRPGGAVPSFLAPDWKTYDWSLDEGQRWTLLAAKERGASVFEAFSNSPPCFMTKSGYASGNWDAKDDNLSSKNYAVSWEKEKRVLNFFFFKERERKGEERLPTKTKKRGGRKKTHSSLSSLLFSFSFKTGLCLLPRRGRLLLQGQAQCYLQVREFTFSFHFFEGLRGGGGGGGGRGGGPVVGTVTSEET